MVVCIRDVVGKGWINVCFSFYCSGKGNGLNADVEWVRSERDSGRCYA